MREEELHKRFSKDFLRRRESKRNAYAKKKEEGKRREEGILVAVLISVSSVTALENSVIFYIFFQTNCDSKPRFPAKITQTATNNHVFPAKITTNCESKPRFSRRNDTNCDSKTCFSRQNHTGSHARNLVVVTRTLKQQNLQEFPLHRITNSMKFPVIINIFSLSGKWKDWNKKERYKSLRNSVVR